MSIVYDYKDIASRMIDAKPTFIGIDYGKEDKTVWFSWESYNDKFVKDSFKVGNIIPKDYKKVV